MRKKERLEGASTKVAKKREGSLKMGRVEKQFIHEGHEEARNGFNPGYGKSRESDLVFYLVFADGLFPRPERQ